MKYLESKLKKKLTSKKSILILVGVVSIVLVSVWGYNWYPSFVFEQQANNILSSNVTVDSNIIDYLRENGWTAIIVSLYSEKEFSYTSNVTLNKEIYKNKAEYYDEIKDTVLLTLNEREFMLGSKFHGLSGFAGDITIEGLEKLANNPKVKEIKSGYSEINVGTSTLLITNVNCYENFVEVIFRNTLNNEINTAESIMTVIDINDNLIGIDADLSPSAIIKVNEFGNLISTNISLTPSEKYGIKIEIGSHAQTSDCIAQAGGSQ